MRLKRGKLLSNKVTSAISDITRISEEVEQGINKLFRMTMSVSVFGRTNDELQRNSQFVTTHFRSHLAQVRPLRFRQGRGFHSMMPALRPGVGGLKMTDTSTLLRMFPFGPGDLDRREGTFFGMDLRSRTPVMFDPFAPSAMNGHMVVMARSGAGKSFFTKLRVVREVAADVPVYLIDPEGEYGVITRTLGGDVYVPGAPGYGLNPFVIDYKNQGDLAQRCRSLNSLICVMLEGQTDIELKATIDRCVTGFYADEIRRLTGDRPAAGQRRHGGLPSLSGE